MNDKDLIKAYKELKNSEAPDLWSRIEGSIDTASFAEKVNDSAQEQPVTARPNKILPLKKYNKFIFGSAAVILVVLVASAVVKSPLLKKSFDRVANEDFNGLQPGFNSQEEAELSQNAESKYDPYYDYTIAPTTTIAPSYNTSDVQTSVETNASQKADADNETPTEIRGESTTPVFDDMPGKYSELEFADIKPVSLPTVTVAQSPQTRYFTMDTFTDTELLVQATVQSINFIFNDSKEATSVVYTILTDNVYFSEGDYPSMGRYSDGTELLTVTSPIIKADDVWMYPLKVNRTYLLPLTVTDTGAINLVFPYAPQIELSLDGFCVFHSGWQALVNDNTGYLLVECVHPEDYFYDRMLVRPADGFAKDLMRIIKSLKD